MARPFSQSCYDLGPAELVDSPPHAETIGAILAAIDPWQRNGRTHAEMAARFRDPDPGVARFAVMRDDAVVGGIIVRFPFLKGAYLETLGLAATARGSGIGRAIIDWMGREIDGRANNLWLCVTEWNTPARAFYTMQGFTEVAPLPGLVVEDQAEILMRKQIWPADQ
jgi:ribosomal protein S18 acetylase RimI-like enzyme